MDHEGRWLVIFLPDGRESAHLRKMIKMKEAKMWYLEILEKERSKVSLLGPLRIGKPAGGF